MTRNNTIDAIDALHAEVIERERRYAAADDLFAAMLQAEIDERRASLMDDNDNFGL